MPRKFTGRGCLLFYCQRRKGYYCCGDCGYRTSVHVRCKEPCQNEPAACQCSTPTASRYGTAQRKEAVS